MKSAGSMVSRSVSRLRVLSAVLAVVGQLGVFGASLTLAREETSAISHTEQSGTNLHHGHNEASCVACTALSFHAMLNPSSPPIPSAEVSLLALARSSDDLAGGPQLLSNSCRAPPREA
jgi:hypothetical protein